MKRTCVNLILLGFAVILNAQQKSLETFISEAQDLRTKRQFQEAVDLLLEAVEIYPNESNGHLQLGLAWGDLLQKAGETNNMMLAMKGVNEAFAEFDKAIQLNPDNFEAYLNYGAFGVNVPALFGKVDQGVIHLEKAKSLLEKTFPDGNPEVSAVVYRFLGQGYQMQGRSEEARTAWKKVLELTPENEHGMAAQAGLESLEKETEIQEQIPQKESPEVAALKQKIEKSPNDFQLRLALGQTYTKEKNWADAQRALKEAEGRLERRKAEEALQRIEWLLKKKPTVDS
ncbi:tetratricopeptide repeat protein, partial [bacterium]|nr:tetratricopeptide repeat protein [bacterium]